MNSEVIKKLAWFLMGGLGYFVLLICLLYLFSKYGSGLLLLYMPLFIFLSSLIGVAIWWYKFHNGFESFLVYTTYVGFGFAFVFLAPFAVERSLSTFILFYAAEHDGISQVNFSSEYKNVFFQKRFDDAVKGGFLYEENGLYKPTLRTEIYYNMLYPLGVATNLLGNYEQFVREVEIVDTRKR